MKWPEFVERFPGAEASTFRTLESGKLGPVMFRVRFGDRTVEMADKPGVLAEVAAQL